MCTAIEHLWSTAKNNFRKLLTLLDEPLTEDLFRKLVKQSLDMVPQPTIENLVRSNRRYLAEKLKEIDQ